MDNTRIATLDGSYHSKYNKLVGVGIGLLLSFLMLGAVIAAMVSGVFVQASNDAPTELIISQITDTSAHLEWATNLENQGFVEYGVNASALNQIVPEVTSTRTHSLDLTFLKPDTTYYFHIKVGDKVFDNSGLPWTFSTKPEQAGVQTIEEEPQPQAIDAPPSSQDGACPATDCAGVYSNLGRGCNSVDLIRLKCN